MLLHFIFWYLLSTFFGLAGLPLAFQLFRRLPGRGLVFSRALGLLAVTWLFWLLGCFGLLRNNAAGLLFCWLLLALAGLAWLRREGLHELRAWLRSEWQALLGVELVFFAAFALWTAVRAYNPQILGTEKPMELMFLNSLLNSPNLPPQDAWLSGHAISYYYFGYLLVASLARLAATPAPVAFNLALGLWFALAAAGALGVGMDLVALAQGASAPPGRRLRHAFFPGLLAPLLLLLVGNLYGALALAHANGLFATARLPALVYDFGVKAPESLKADGAFIRRPGLRAEWVNGWDWLDLKRLTPAPAAAPLETQLVLENWFFAARVVHDRDLDGDELEAIDENPAFSFLLGDLHPHLLALPFVLLAAALALETLLWARAGQAAARWLYDSPARLGLAALCLGSLFSLNTWDYPIYAFLLWLALLAGFWPAAAGGRAGAWELLRHTARLGLPLLVLSLAANLPYLLSMQSQAGGLLPNLLTPTRLRQFLVMFTPLLFPGLAWLGWRCRRGKPSPGLAWRVAIGLLLTLSLAAGLLAWAALSLPELRPYIHALLAPFSIPEALGLVAQRRLADGLLGLLLAGMVGVCAALLAAGRRENAAAEAAAETAAEAATLAMLLSGALLALGPEFLYLRDNFGIRMNTLFKFYFQTWVLWSLAGAFGLWRLWQAARKGARALLLAGAGLGLLPGLVFLPAALWSKTGGFAAAPTLDGLAYFARDDPHDWAAIQWLQAHAAPGEVIVEGSRGAYWVEGRSGRISMATGLPTLLGWANHESQWRGEYFEQVAGRQDELRQIYTGRDWGETQSLLDRYRVKYILVSDLERAWYQPLQQEKLEQNLEAVFASGDLVIYQNGK